MAEMSTLSIKVLLMSFRVDGLDVVCAVCVLYPGRSLGLVCL